MTKANLQKSISVNITKLKRSETVTKELLSTLSRDCLEYIGLNHSPDIATVNRLLGVLTPVNRKAVAVFFNFFLPFKLNDETGTFGGMVKGDKLLDKYQEKVDEFMADPDNDIWVWCDRNITVAEKPKEFAEKLQKMVKRAMNDENEGINPAEVLAAVMAGGVSLNDVFLTIAAIQASTATPENIASLAPAVEGETLAA